MMRLPVRALGWSLNTLGVAVTITLSVWPDARNWFLDHAGLGWLLVISLALATAVLGQVVYHQSRQRLGLASANDERLLAEWLDGWRQNSDFMLWLDTNFTSAYLPHDAVLGIDRRIDAWASDKRTLNDPELAELFDRVAAAARQFREATWETWEDRDGLLEVPKEWKGQQHERYMAAHKAIGAGRTAVLEALTSLFAAMHKRGMPS
jgi:hypothetical protein